MESEIKYNVTTIINTNINDEKEMKRTFNAKLLKIIISLENREKCSICQ